MNTPQEYLMQMLGAAKEDVIEAEIAHLTPYPEQPFKPYKKEKLEELAEDIKQNGIYSPILVRQLDRSYQILAGHNRVEAAKLAGLSSVPVIVKNVDDTQAKLIMLSTNLNQRDELLPSEKAFAYKMQMEAMKKQGQRTVLTLSPLDTKLEQNIESPLDTKLDTASEIAKSQNESRANIFRYIRLTYLVPALLDMTDSKQIPFRAAVNISYLSEQWQKFLLEYINTNRIENITLEQSESLKQFGECLNTERLDEIFGKIKKAKQSQPKFFTFKIPVNYVDEEVSKVEIDDECMKRVIEVIKQYGKEKSNG